jgi:hypothetical protein
MTATTIPARLARVPREQLLRLTLQVDAVVSGANGVAYLVLAGPLADLFEVPEAFLRVTGAVLVVFAAGVWLASRRPLRWGAAVVAANIAWVLASLTFAVLEVDEPSTAGVVWTVLQAIVVALFAGLQIAGLRRAEGQPLS